MKRVAVLGSTGSIGRMTLEVILRNSDRFSVSGLAAGSNIDLLEEQINIFRPRVVAVADKEAALSLRKRVGTRVEVCAGEEGITAVAGQTDADFVLAALVGFSGLVPALAAVRAGKSIGLANKEALVVAGDLVMDEAEKHGATILPVDSEHSAVFQCIEGHDRRYVSRIILTASGGPFLGMAREDLGRVEPEDALKHPNWSMGKKITIDSATLMNKGLEVIEASHLFGVGPQHVDVVIHPQSIIHSMVEFKDGGLLAQMSVPDMRGPIAYALAYPERLENTMPRLDLADMGTLTFQAPDTERFPCLGLAYEALGEGGTMLAVLNAANEVVVHAFLERRISFDSIPVIINDVMHSHSPAKVDGLGVVVEADGWARRRAEELVRNRR